MVEIFHHLNTRKQFDKNEVKSQDKLIGCTISNVHRLIFFSKSQGLPIYINFVDHKIVPGNLYIIPAGHLLYLPLGTHNFSCIYRPHSQISNVEKYWIYQQKYKGKKTLDIDKSEIELLSQSPNTIISRLATDFSHTNNIPPVQYLQQADELCSLISSIICNHKLSVSDLVKGINTTEKTLQRVCNTVFGKNPIHIIRYQLQLKIMFQILSRKDDSFSEIANDLRFMSSSTFGRYVKSLSGFTPKEIRDNHPHILI